jgi:hypothetical protein
MKHRVPYSPHLTDDECSLKVASSRVAWFLEKGLGAPADVMVLLGNRVREWAPYVRIETRALWAEEPMRRKIGALLRGRWKPDGRMAQDQAKDTYKARVFGEEADWGHHLLLLNTWHLQREWKLEALTDGDQTRATALASFTVLTRLRYDEVAVSPLNLHLGQRAPMIASLTFPMVAKMPVISVRYFLDIHPHFAFDAVRQAKHPFADDIVAFLYELLFLQQKVAIGLLEFVRLVSYAETHKKKAQIINAEVNAIMAADGIFANLKASVEKTIALIGVTHGVADIDAKKDHKARLAALRKRLPANIDSVYYARFLFDMIATANLDDLNKYRAGLLHKKGIADLQPHNYVGKEAEAVPLRKVFQVMHEQHSRNTASLLVALALLTDDLVRRDPPEFSLADIPTEPMIQEMRKWAESRGTDVFPEEEASSSP